MPISTFSTAVIWPNSRMFMDVGNAEGGDLVGPPAQDPVGPGTCPRLASGT